MVFSNVIVNVTIPRRSFVFGQSCAYVSAGYTNVRSLAVAALDLVYCIIYLSARKRDGLSVIASQKCYSVGNINQTTFSVIGYSSLFI